jgi:hypothetical protein
MLALTVTFEALWGGIPSLLLLYIPEPFGMMVERARSTQGKVAQF